MSDATTPDTAPDTTHGLGRGVADRARNQSVLARRRTSARLVGAVGRASVGFGLAVGRSRAIRPVVRRNELNSSALRPPTGFWHERIDEGALWDDAGSWSRHTTEPRPTGTTSATPRPQRETGTAELRRAARGGRTRPTPRRRTASWTDQVIARSSVGYVPAAASVAEPAPVPDDFVSSGDGKLDELRLLLKARKDEPDTTPAQAPVRRSSTAAAEPTAADNTPVRSATAESAALDGGRVAGVRGDTAAGHGTGPGRLARNARPTSAIPGTDLGPSRRSPGTSGSVGLPGTGVPPTSAEPRPRRSATPPRRGVDDLRAALIEQGMIRGPEPADDDARADDARADDRRDPGPASPVRRSPAREGSDRRERDRPSGVAERATGQASAPAPGTSQRRPDRVPVSERLRRAADDTIDTTDRSPRPGRGGEGRAAGGEPDPSATTSSLIANAMPTANATPTATAVLDEPVAPATVLPTLGGRHRGDLRRRVTLPRALSTTHRPGIRRLGVESVGGPVVQAGVATHRDVVAAPGVSDHLSTGLRDRSTGQPSRPVSDGVRDDSTGHSSRSAPSRSVPGTNRDGDERGVSVASDGVGHDSTGDALRSVPGTNRDGGERGGSVADVGSGDQRVQRRHDRSVGERPVAPAGVVVAREATQHPGGPMSLPGAPSSAGAESTISRSVVAEPTGTGLTRDAGQVATPTPVRRERSDAPDRSTRPDRPDRPDRWPSAPVSTAPAGEPAANGGPAPSGEPGVAVRTPFVGRIDSGRAVGDLLRRVISEPSSHHTASQPARAVDGPTRPAGGSTAISTVASRPSAPSAPAPPSAPAARSVGDADRRDQVVGTPHPVERSVRPARERSASGESGAESTVTRTHDGVAASPHSSQEASDTSAAPSSRPSVRPAPELAQRFMTELSASIQRSPAPLPVAYRPMADAITAGRSGTVMLSTDAASRRALRKVGKVAATTDNVIHLATPPSATPTPRVNEVIAHELTHVAHPSPVARFFDDVDDSPEERQAERVARVMASSPIAPSASTLAPGRAGDAGSPGRAAGRRGPDIVRRSPAAGSAPAAPGAASTSSGGLSAAALAASITGRSAPSVRRLADDSAATTAPPSVSPSSSPSGGSNGAGGASGSSGSGGGAGASLPGSSEATDEWLMEQWERNLDRIVASLERRIMVEIERRGGRIWREI